MKIAVVSPYSWTVPSGVNNHVMSLATQLEERGHEPWIIAPAGTLLHRAKNMPDNFIVAGRTIPAKSNGSVAHANVSPWMIQTMSIIYARHQFDLVHVHEPHCPTVGASAALAAKTPVVATFHAAGYASCYYERWRPLATRIHSCITSRITVSEAARECVSRYFPDDYRVIPSPIVVETYAKAREGEKVPGRILFLGRPEPRKGLKFLVQAFSELRRRLPEASLTLVGTSYDELRSSFSRNGDSAFDQFEGIEALGRLSLEDKIEQMRRAEVLCAPSIGGESFGLVLTEAMAAGLPVIASDIPGYRAVMADGAAGVLVCPEDVADLERALFSTLTDPQLRRDLTAGGIERADHFSWERAINKIVGVYEEALSLGPRHTEGAKVPVFKQACHFARTYAANSKKRPREARSNALS